MKKRKLTIHEADNILSVKDGADVYGYTDAKAFREIQREVAHGAKYLTFVPAVDPPKSVYAKQPYFGIIATKKGIEAAKKTLKSYGRYTP